jgi:hypothetical protein
MAGFQMSTEEAESNRRSVFVGFDAAESGLDMS